MSQTTVCSSCGAKFAIARDRCPRCRAHAVKVDLAAEAARSHRMARAAGILLGSFLLALGLLWIARGSEPRARATVAAPAGAVDQRPDADSAAAGEAATQPAPDPSAEDQRRFMEPAAAATLAYASGDYQAALAKLEEAVKRNPQDPEALNNLGQVLVKLGRSADALPHFERACGINGDKWSYRFNLARALGQLNRWDESIASYRQAQQLYPNDYVTTFNLALALHKTGEDAAAVAEYAKAVALNPEDASFRMALGISYEALQKNQDAAAAYAEYLRLSPAAPDAEKVRARIAQLQRQAAPAPAALPVTNPAGS